MKINPGQLTQVFKAYTRQLRGEYAKASRESAYKPSRARGYEKVELSQEALALSAARSSGNESSEEVKQKEKEEEKKKDVKEEENEKSQEGEAKPTQVKTPAAE